MAGISSKAAGKLENKRKFNGGNELQSKEFSDGSGLEMYDAVHRMYDAQLGRFHQVDAYSDIFLENSPYTFASNNPILVNDPLGLADSTDKKGNVWHELNEVTVKSTPKNKNHDNSPNNGMQGFTTLIGSADTYFDVFHRNYDHKNYITTKGKLKPFPDEMRRMSQQAKVFKLRSYTIKNTGFGISLLANALLAIQVRDQYLNGQIDPVDATGLTLGITGLIANGLNFFRFAPNTMGAISEFTGVGGMVIGTYQSWMFTFKTIYNTNLPNSIPKGSDANIEFQAAMDDEKVEGNRWQ
jgi:RHS repeat-associated protein